MLSYLFAMALAQVAQSAASAGSPPAQPGGSWREQVFVSPAGEPFRVPEGRPYPLADWFAQADTNHDGKLTAAEFAADFLRYAAILDTDHDGIIDGAEVDAYELRIVPEVHSGATFSYSTQSSSDGESTSYSGPPADSMPMGAGKYGLINLPEPVTAMDTDINGRITRREVADAADYRFSLLDTEGRGYLSLDKLPQPFAQNHRGKVSGGRHHHRD